MVLNVSCDNIIGYFMNLKEHFRLGKMGWDELNVLTSLLPSSGIALTEMAAASEVTQKVICTGNTSPKKGW